MDDLPGIESRVLYEIQRRDKIINARLMKEDEALL